MEIVTRDSLRIVHVEDNSEYAAISAIFLRRAGFGQPIIRFRNGVEAIRYFSTIESRRVPHLILLDLHMPQSDGLEVLHWLRRGPSLPDIPIYLLTSSDDPEDRRRAAAAGVTGYLLKAPVFDEVIRSLDEQIAILNRQFSHQPRAAQDAGAQPSRRAGEDLPVAPKDAVSH